MFANDNQVGGLLPQTLLKQRFATVEPVEQNSVRALYRGIDTHNGNHRVAILEMSQAKPGAAEPAETTGPMHLESSLLSSLRHPNVPLGILVAAQMERVHERTRRMMAPIS